MATAPDFSQFTKGLAPGAQTSNLAAVNLMGRANINNEATWQAGKNQTNYLNEQMPQLRSGIAATGQHYSGAGDKAMGHQKRRYEDSQYDIFRGAHNALDQLTMQQAYAATGLIVG